ncbi:MAG: hypothetical protein LBU40_03360 [Methanobrevibacter sp.]|jgi:hypothetical protein|nr:hypothetical protein [Methanobrevibacter sp.]
MNYNLKKEYLKLVNKKVDIRTTTDKTYLNVIVDEIDIKRGLIFINNHVEIILLNLNNINCIRARN